MDVLSQNLNYKNHWHACRAVSLTPRGTTLISYALSRSIAAPITIAAPLALAILTCAGAALHRAPPIQNSILTYENLKKKTIYTFYFKILHIY